MICAALSDVQRPVTRSRPLMLSVPDDVRGAR